MQNEAASERRSGSCRVEFKIGEADAPACAVVDPTFGVAEGPFGIEGKHLAAGAGGDGTAAEFEAGADVELVPERPAALDFRESHFRFVG